MQQSTTLPKIEHYHRLHLSGDWQVQSIPIDADVMPDLSFENALSIPEAVHLQPTLYPEQPYWGDHLRKINEQAWIYQRRFNKPQTGYKRVKLHFEGVDHFADVWLNGHYLGQHEGHFAPFEFDITDDLQDENVLLVRVSSPWDQPNPKGSYPIDHVIRGLVKGLYEHGEGVIPPNVNPIGIWRPAWLLLDQGLSIDHIRIITQTDGQVRLRFKTMNSTGQTWQGSLGLKIAGENHDGAGIQTQMELDLPIGEHWFEQTVQIPNPQLWWTWDHGKPNLYRLTATLEDENATVLSHYSAVFGIRTVELDRTPDRFTYYLNGRTVFIRGSAYIPSLYLSQCDEKSLGRDVQLAKDANLNLLRIHTHVSPLELYDLCDRMGMLIWQDFELNWVHDTSLEFEVRARKLQREMIDLLGNHPSIITWICHNEPTMIFTRRANLEAHPDPSLYADAMEQDPTRPVFICSGQMETDWRRAGDVHTYYGALWTKHYTDVYQHHFRFNTEFGFEAPAAVSTLQAYSFAWERLKHLEPQIDDLWAYQAELVQFHTEHLRRLRAECSGGYIHFWLADLVPQVGCGVLDAHRLPKGGYGALQRASQPMQVALEHDGKQPHALWVFNDTPEPYADVTICWSVRNAQGICVLEGQIPFNVQANASQKVTVITWTIPPEQCAHIELKLVKRDGGILAQNGYQHPFQPTLRPHGYPWKFDPVLGVKVFNHPKAPSLADQTKNPLIKIVPLGLRETIAEWALRQQLPPRLLSFIAWFGARFLGQ